MGRLFNSDGSAIAAPANSGGGGRVDWNAFNASHAEAQKKKKQQDELVAIADKSSSLKYNDRIRKINDAAKQGILDKKTQIELINHTVDQQNPIKDLSGTDKAILAAGDIVKGIPKAVFDSTIGAAGNTLGNIYSTANTSIKQGAASTALATYKDQSKFLDSQVAAGKLSKKEAEARKSKSLAAVDKARSEASIALKNSNQIDSTKAAGDAASTALNIGTLGTAGIAKSLIGGTAKGITENIAKNTVAGTAKKLAANAGKESLLGGAYGGTGTASEKGKEATFEDFKNNIIAGAAIGGAVPLAGTLKKLAPVKAVDTFISDTAKKAGVKIETAVAKTNTGQAIIRGVEKAKVALGDSLAPVMNDFKGLVDKTDGRQINENVRQLDTNVMNSAAITEGRLKENSSWQELADLVKPTDTRPGSLRAARKEKDALGAFISEKQDAINANKLNPKTKIEVPVGTPKQEKAYELLNKATKDDVQYAFDNNLITKSNYKKYMADDNYTRVQRDMGNTIQSNFKGVGGPNGSISSTIFSQRLRGSKKAALDPFASHFDWSNKVTREVQRQKLSNYIIEKRKEHGLGEGYLRKASTVEDRQAAIGEANQLRVLRNGLGKAVKSETKYGKRLEQELNGLNKKGMQASIKNAGSSKTVEKPTRTITIKDTPEQVKVNAPTKLDDIKTSYGVKAKLQKVYGKSPDGVTKMSKDLRSGGWKKLQQKTGMSSASAQKIAKQLRKKPTITESSRTITEGQIGRTSGAKAHIDTLVKTSTADLTRIRNKVKVREPKLAAHIDNLIGLKKQHEVAAKAVKEMTDIARANGDKAAVGKTTIKTFTRGIKEVYEDDPRIVDAINKVGRVELHALVKAAQAPSKLIQRTATALNFVFTASNLAKDQVSSAILSKNVLATHTPISFMIGLKEAALKPTAKALLRGVGARGASEVRVLQPTKEYEQFLKFVAGSTRTDINRELKSTARRTNEMLGLKNENFVRKVENINSATENLTRFQNYIGTVRDGVKKGLDAETVQKNAIQAARENSVDFNRSGDWAPFLKIFNPFVNANIQGSRSLLRAFAERPAGTTLKVGATILAPIAAATYYNLSDPKRALIYSQLSDSDKANNLLFITADGNVFKLPLPPGVKEFGAPVRGVIEAEYGMDNSQDFIKTAKSIFLDSVNPFNLGDVVPQFSKPIVEGITNYNFFTGKAIVPDYLKAKDTKDQVFKGTSQTYRDVANRFGISPLIAKNIITGYGSSVAEQGISLFDQLRKAGGQDVTTDKRNTIQQLQGKFFANKPDQTAAANTVFFNAYDPLKARKDKVSKEVTTLVKSGNLEQAKRAVTDFNNSINPAFDKFSKDYGSGNNDITQDPMWSDMKKSLSIAVTDKAFKARSKQ